MYVQTYSKQSGYAYFSVPNFEMMFTKSIRGESAKEVIDTLLYNYGYCSESISITTIPIYHLEPNSRIYINDMNTGIEGDYIISKLTIPLGHSGTMTITATKAPKRLL